MTRSLTPDESLNGLILEDGTNPWIEVDGLPVDWMVSTLVEHPALAERAECDNRCNAGVLLAMDTESGIQRCDECGTFDGDIEAAFFVAALVDGVVWVHDDTDD